MPNVPISKQPDKMKEKQEKEKKDLKERRKRYFFLSGGHELPDKIKPSGVMMKSPKWILDYIKSCSCGQQMTTFQSICFAEGDQEIKNGYNAKKYDVIIVTYGRSPLVFIIDRL